MESARISGGPPNRFWRLQSKKPTAGKGVWSGWKFWPEKKPIRRPDSGCPEQTLEAIRQFGLALKGPLTTPVGQGIRSLNVQIRQVLDLYVCLRPVRYFTGVPSPMRHPELVNMVIFRENTEDVYSGIEWPAESAEAIELSEWIEKKTGKKLNPESGIGIKPISRSGTQRLVRRAIEYALRRGKPSVTLVHKGNIMKFTEGAFRNWGYELAQKEFPNETLTEAEVDQHPGDKQSLQKKSSSKTGLPT